MPIWLAGILLALFLVIIVLLIKNKTSAKYRIVLLVFVSVLFVLVLFYVLLTVLFLALI